VKEKEYRKRSGCTKKNSNNSNEKKNEKGKDMWESEGGNKGGETFSQSGNTTTDKITRLAYIRLLQATAIQCESHIAFPSRMACELRINFHITGQNAAHTHAHTTSIL